MNNETEDYIMDSIRDNAQELGQLPTLHDQLNQFIDMENEAFCDEDAIDLEEQARVLNNLMIVLEEFYQFGTTEQLLVIITNLRCAN